MAQAYSTAPCSVFDPRAEMLLPDSFLFRKERNWLVDGPTAQCNDNNFGNVAIFSKRKIRRRSNTSFLLTISCSKSLDRCVIGLADDNFRQSNDDMRAHSEYGYLEFKPGNELLGTARETFNIGVSLEGETYVGGARTQEKKTSWTLPKKKIRVRATIGDNELRVIAPDIWGERHVVERIQTTDELRLAICAPQGFSFKLEEIQERFTLKKEAVPGFSVDMPDEYLEQWCKRRYKKIVKKLRKATNPTETTITTNINIVIVGAFGAGKSSLVNTLLTAFSPSHARPRAPAFVMNDSSGQGTRVMDSFTLTPKLKLLDAIGMDAIDSTVPGKTNWGNVLEPLLRGEIGQGFRNEFLEVNTASPAENALDGTKQTATESKQTDESLPGIIPPESLDVHSMNHGVLLVGNPNMQEDFALIHSAIARLCGEMGMPIFGVITQLDRGVRDFSVKKLYTDPMLGELYDATRAMMTVHCFPVRCYTREDQGQNPMYNWLAVEALDALFTEAVEYKRRLGTKFGVDIEIPPLDASSDESD